MRKYITPEELLKEARYGFRGTDLAFYIYQLQASIVKFGQEGYYSALSTRSRTSITLCPIYAWWYAETAHSRAKKGVCDPFTDKPLEVRPIIQVIDLTEYKSRTFAGLECAPVARRSDLRGIAAGLEFEIEGTIATRDIQILDTDSVHGLEHFLLPFPQKQVRRWKRHLFGFLESSRPSPAFAFDNPRRN